MTVQLAWTWNSTNPAAPSGRLNSIPGTDNATPLASDTMHIPNGGGGGVEYRTTTAEALGQADQGKIISFSNAGSTAVTINTPTDPGWKCAVFNQGAGVTTFTPSGGTINGAANLALPSGQNGALWWDGINYLMSMISGGGSSVVIEANGTPTSNQALLNITGSGGVVITNPSGGIVNIALSSGGTGPNPATRRWAYGSSINSNMGGTAAGAWVGDSAGAAGSTLSFQAASGGTFDIPTSTFIQTSSASLASVQSNLASGGSGWTRVGKNMLWTCRAGISVITNIRLRIGVGATGTVATWIGTDALTAISYASFRFSTSASDTNFMCETSNGSAQTVTNSGIAAAANTLYTFQIQLNDATPNVVFSINASVVQTHTTHLPVSGAGISFLMAIKPQTNTSETMFVGWIYEEADN